MKNEMKPPCRSLSRLLAGAGAFALAACAETDNISRFDATSNGTLVATTRAESGGGTKPAMESAGDPEGIVRLHGRLLYLKNRGTTLIHGRQRVTNGLYLEKNGDVTLADGRRIRVVEGYMVTTGGDVIEAPNYLR